MNYSFPVTLAGQAKIAAAVANAGTIDIAAVAAGDGNGAPVTPNVNMTGLVREFWRGAAISVSRDPDAPSQVLVRVIIPSSAAPATVRELALYTGDGQLFAIGNYPDVPIVPASDGARNELDVTIPIRVDTAADVTIQINPAALVPLAQLLRAPFIAADAFAATPPANPAVGALVIVAANPTGGFANRAHQFAQWSGSLWLFCPAPIDTIIGNAADHKYYRRTVTGWTMIPLGELPVASGEGVALGGEPIPHVNLAYPSLTVGVPANPDLISYYSQAHQRHEVITLENLIALIRTAVGYVATPAPVAADFAANGMNGTASTVNAGAHVTGGFTSLAIVNAAASGATVAGGSITIPSGTAAGVYAITYRATGPGGQSNTATLTFTQAAFVAAPVAQSFAVSGTNGTASAIPLLPRVSGAYASIAIVDAVGSGASIAGTTLSIPAETAPGTYAITYRATGPGGVSNTATVTLTQAAAVPAPVASGFAVYGTNGTVSTIGLASRITGAYTSVAIIDAAGSGATIAGATVTIPATTPAGNYNITFQATGPGGVSNVATLAFTQAAYVAPPVAINFAASGMNGTATAVALAARITGAYTSIAIINASGSGATIAGSTVTIPANTAPGAYAITFQATGPGGASNVATLTFTQSSKYGVGAVISATDGGISAVFTGDQVAGWPGLWNGTTFQFSSQFSVAAPNAVLAIPGGANNPAGTPNITFRPQAGAFSAAELADLYAATWQFTVITNVTAHYSNATESWGAGSFAWTAIRIS